MRIRVYTKELKEKEEGRMKKNRIFMGTTIGALILLFLAIGILSTTRTVSGQYEIGEDFITVDPHARGTELQTTLTIYYPPTFNDSGEYVIGYHAGPFFMRIKKGDERYGFAGNFENYHFPPNDPIPWDNTTLQTQALDEFFRTVVIPTVFPNHPSASYAIKSYGNLAQGNILLPDGIEDTGPTGGGYIIFNLVIAVQKK